MKYAIHQISQLLIICDHSLRRKTCVPQDILKTECSKGNEGKNRYVYLVVHVWRLLLLHDTCSQTEIFIGSNSVYTDVQSNGIQPMKTKGLQDAMRTIDY